MATVTRKPRTGDVPPLSPALARIAAANVRPVGAARERSVTLSADALKAGLSGRQNQLPPAQGNKPVRNALDRARGGGPRKIPTNTTPKGRAKLSNKQAATVDPNKGAAGEQMGFGGMYKKALTQRKVAEIRSRGRL